MSDIDCLVIGAGVVGLAVARALALAGREVVIAEAADGIGTQTSARNSEVIHAGIYYPPGSLKAQVCVEGRKLLYAYLQRARPALQGLRQADRRDHGGAEAWRWRRSWPARRPRAWTAALGRCGGSQGAGAGSPLRDRAALARDRRGRQPCADAVAARRMRGGRRVAGAEHADHRLAAGERRLQRRFRRRRSRDLYGPHHRQLSRTWRAEAAGRSSKASRAACAGAAFRQGQLLRPARQAAFLASGLSDSGSGRPRHPRHHRHGRPGQVRPGCGMGGG